ncbi:hypothetical protein L6R52_34020 [Myxococcota bacterium]|nr:hypothetical protein [Myxococcota bacterium]
MILASAIGLVAALLATAEARAATTAIIDGRVVELEEEDDLGMIGFMLDAGVPDGAAASLVLRPWSWLRLSGGVTTNVVSQGYRAGLTLVPFDTWATLTLSAEAGRTPDGDVNALIQVFGEGYEDLAVLRRVSYDYVNGHVGLEFGREAMTLYLHAGMTYLSAAFGDGTDELGDGTTMTLGDRPTIRGWVPSAKVGLILYLF